MDPQVVETTNREPSALSELLQEHRAKKGWTYRTIAEEIQRQTGYRRTESTVRFCVVGHAGNKGYKHRGLRTMGDEPSTLALVAHVLEVPEKRLRAAYAQDLFADGMSISLQADNGYCGLTLPEQRRRIRKRVVLNQKRALSRTG